MNIFETYDKLIENIQQIPLDVYLFIRKNTRINLKLDKLINKYNKLLKYTYRGYSVDEEKIKKLSTKIFKLRKVLIDSSDVLKKVLLDLQEKSDKICNMNYENNLLPKLDIENINRIVKVGRYKEHGPYYCICKQKAYDNMIACNNTNCRIKWFHFVCAGITLPPKSVWYCTECKKMK